MGYFISDIILNFIKIMVTILSVILIHLARPEDLRSGSGLSLIFIGVGACLFMIVTLTLSPFIIAHPQNIALDVMLGLIILGIIVILKDKISAKSISSVATIWLSGAVGLSIGIGLFFEGIFIAFLSYLFFKWMSPSMNL